MNAKTLLQDHIKEMADLGADIGNLQEYLNVIVFSHYQTDNEVLA